MSLAGFIALIVVAALVWLLKVAQGRAARNVLGLLLGIALMFAVALLAGCSSGGGSKLPTLPEVVDNVIEKPKPLPGWATIELPLPQLASGKLGDHLSYEDQLRATVRLANCHRKLSDRISRGEHADPGTCGPGPLGPPPVVEPQR